MKYICRMGNNLLIFVLSFVLVFIGAGCQESESNHDSVTLASPLVKANFELSEKEYEELLDKKGEGAKAKLFLGRDTLKAKIKLQHGKYSIKLKGENRYNGMKSFSIFKTSKSIIKEYEEKRDSAQLYSILMPKIERLEFSLNGKKEEGNFLLIENIDKRLLERNSRREGLILNNKGRELVCVNKGYGTKLYQEWAISYVADILNSGIYNSNYTVDLERLLLYKEISSKANYWYLNPIDLKIEPILSFEDSVEVQFKDFTELKNETVPFAFTKLDAYSFITVNEVKNTIRIKEGKYIIKEPLIFPAGFEIIIESGTKLDFIKGAFFLSYSPVKMIGLNSAEIKIISSDNSAKGFSVLNAEKVSILDHVKFKGFSNPSLPHWNISASMLFFRSDVHISNSKFIGDVSGDDMLNIVRSTFKMADCSFKGTFSDAFDGDFVIGEVKKCTFNTVGNDAIDFSGSNIEVEDIVFKNIADKAISAGEKSKVVFSNIQIDNAEIGVASKDASSVIGEDLSIENARLNFAVYCKKKEYGSGMVSVDKYSLMGKKNVREYLLENGSSLKLNGTSIDPNAEKVEDLLYGNEFGKSSK